MEEHDIILSDRRRLSTFSLDEFDNIIEKSFLMLCFGVVSLQILSMMYAYAMPTDQDICTLHCSRIGSVIVVSIALAIPYNLKSVKTRCLQEYEIYEDPNLDDGDFVESNGLAPIQAVIATALIVMASFCVALFSIDVERSHTYKELEEAAHEQRKAVLDKAQLRATLRATLNADRLNRLQSTMNLGASFRMSAVDFGKMMNSGTPNSKSSFHWLTGVGGGSEGEGSSPTRRRSSSLSFDGSTTKQFKRTMKNLVSSAGLTTGLGAARVAPVRSAPHPSSQYDDESEFSPSDDIAELNKIKNRFGPRQRPSVLNSQFRRDSNSVSPAGSPSHSSSISPSASPTPTPIGAFKFESNERPITTSPALKAQRALREPNSPISRPAFEFKDNNDEVTHIHPRLSKRRLTPVTKFNGEKIDSGGEDALNSMRSKIASGGDISTIDSENSSAFGPVVSEPSMPPPEIASTPISSSKPKPDFSQLSESNARDLFGPNPKTKSLRITN
jgi:hypothetical protein